jgi:hypothetical protein
MATQPDLAIALPCVELKSLGELPQIPLLGGAQVNAFVDIAGGTPTDCKLNFNLLVQLGPLFASMACLFKVLAVISALKDFVSNPLKVEGVLKAISDLETCIPPLQIPNIVIMIKHILLLILGFIECVLEQIDSVLKFKLTLDFDGAKGNPTLTKALTCASNSADAALGNTMSSLQPLQFLMTIVSMLAGIAGQSLELPDFSSVTADVSAIEGTVSNLENAVQSLQSIVQSLPG